MSDARDYIEQTDRALFGGPAFPHVLEFPDESKAAWAGMSLRDWFAGMALQGFLKGDAHQILTDQGEDPKKIIKMIVEDSYETADAMLAERRRKP